MIFFVTFELEDHNMFLTKKIFFCCHFYFFYFCKTKNIALLKQGNVFFHNIFNNKYTSSILIALPICAFLNVLSVGWSERRKREACSQSACPYRTDIGKWSECRQIGPTTPRCLSDIKKLTMSENCENDNCLILDRYVVADKISVQLVADGQNDIYPILHTISDQWRLDMDLLTGLSPLSQKLA